MEGGGGGGRGGSSCPQLLDLIPRGREWAVRDGVGIGSRKGHEAHAEEERQLELRLRPPGPEEEWPASPEKEEEDPSVLSLGLFPKPSRPAAATSCAGAKRGFSYTLESHSKGEECFHTMDDRRSQARSPPPAPVVGWPPIRTFRRNLSASGPSKPAPPHPAAENHPRTPPQKTHKQPVDPSSSKGTFVKINMDGVPIGRKVDLRACDGYDSLEKAVDRLFRGLLAAQKEGLPAAGTHGDTQESTAISGLLDGSGECTLVYEDGEGDKMLVGDVPWEMFASMVRRLRVLKSSEISSTLTLGNAIRKRTQPGTGGGDMLTSD